MKKGLYFKILAMGIIVLFVGFGIHPVFAVDIKNFNTDSEDNEKIESGFMIGIMNVKHIKKG